MSYVRVKRSLIILLALVIGLYIMSSFWSVAEEKKQIALTFDDGPHYRYTEEILDILKKHDVKATFFTVGTNAERFPHLIEREISEGHEVANHTYSHKHMADLTDKELEEEIRRWEDAVNGCYEYTANLFRPPEGILTESQARIIKEFGYETVLWTVDTRDWAHNKADCIVDTVLSGAREGGIVLFHDFVSGDSPTPEALDRIIPRLKEMGYEFVTVSELNR